MAGGCDLGDVCGWGDRSGLLAHLQHMGLMKGKLYKRPDVLVFFVAVRLSPEGETHTGLQAHDNLCLTSHCGWL